MNRALCIFPFLTLLLAGCNQPFEPNGPENSTLVIYGMLSSRTDTQFVRLSSTTGKPSAGDITNATVIVTGDNQVIQFRDTTVLWQDTSGHISPTNVYVAYNATIKGGAVYKLQATTPSGLTASASMTALDQPLFWLKPTVNGGFFVLNRQFKTLNGAAILHFYLDYYVLVDGGWELQTEEVPASWHLDADSNQVFVYPTLVPVGTLAAGGTDVMIDSALFQSTRSRVVKRWVPDQVVFLDIRFTVLQIDDALYDYYYINNGPVDNNSIRLDVPVFTNIRGGFGVFGSLTGAEIKYRTR